MAIQDITTDVYGHQLQWQKDHRIRKGNTKIAITKEHVDEIGKCKKDPIYFMEKYCYINDPNKGKTLISLYDWQKDLVNQLWKEKFSILMLPRQSGKSQTLALFMVWYVCFYTDNLSAILANKALVAREIFSRVVDTYQELPHFLKGGVNDMNKSKISLDNGSSIISAATSTSGLRGFTINGMLMIDEAAIIDTNLFNDFYESMYPTISRATNSKLVLVSTPKGMNHFYKMWNDAMKGRNLFKPFTISWDQVPGRDIKFKEETIANIGQDKWSQEFGMSFLGGDDCLLSPAALANLTYENPVETMYEGKCKIYKKPEEKRKYILTCDVATGVGGDYSTINVVDVTDKMFEQVCVYADNTIELTMFPYIIEKLAKMYNEGLVLVENNAEGVSVCDVLFNEIEYPELYIDNKNIGVRTTKSTKRTGVHMLKELIENHGIKINDFQTIQELSNFVEKGKSFAASGGNHDDIVMGLVLFGYLFSTAYFKEYIEKNFSQLMFKKRMKEIEEEAAINFSIGYNDGQGSIMTNESDDGFKSI